VCPVVCCSRAVCNNDLHHSTLYACSDGVCVQECVDACACVCLCVCVCVCALMPMCVYRLRCLKRVCMVSWLGRGNCLISSLTEPTLCWAWDTEGTKERERERETHSETKTKRHAR